ncbi:hypothetical protein D3C80_2005510 [compost metagenome]
MIIIVATRFQQQDAIVRVFREAVGENASRTSRSDDDIVKFRHAILHGAPLPRRPGRGGAFPLFQKILILGAENPVFARAAKRKIHRSGRAGTPERRP